MTANQPISRRTIRWMARTNLREESTKHVDDSRRYGSRARTPRAGAPPIRGYRSTERDLHGWHVVVLGHGDHVLRGLVPHLRAVSLELSADLLVRSPRTERGAWRS